jgi:hypothetical protein
MITESKPPSACKRIKRGLKPWIRASTSRVASHFRGELHHVLSNVHAEHLASIGAQNLGGDLPE